MGEPDLVVVLVDPQQESAPVSRETFGGVCHHQRILQIVVNPSLHRTGPPWAVLDEDGQRHQRNTHELGQQVGRNLTSGKGPGREVMETSLASNRFVHPQPVVRIAHQESAITGIGQGTIDPPWRSGPRCVWQVPGVRRTHHTSGLR